MAASIDTVLRDEIILPPSTFPYLIKITGSRYYCDIISRPDISDNILELCYTSSPPKPISIYKSRVVDNLDYEINRQSEVAWTNYNLPATTTFVLPGDQALATAPEVLEADLLQTAVNQEQLSNLQYDETTSVEDQHRPALVTQKQTSSAACDTVSEICRQQEVMFANMAYSSNTVIPNIPVPDPIIPIPQGPSFNDRQQMLIDSENQRIRVTGPFHNQTPKSSNSSTKQYFKSTHHQNPLKMLSGNALAAARAHKNPILRPLLNNQGGSCDSILEEDSLPHLPLTPKNASAPYVLLKDVGKDSTSHRRITSQSAASGGPTARPTTKRPCHPSKADNIQDIYSKTLQPQMNPLKKKKIDLF